MKRSTFLLIAAILFILIGGISLFFPDKMADGFGMSSDQMVIFLLREVGVANICFGVLNFLVRNDHDSKSLKSIFIFNGVFQSMMVLLNIFIVSQGLLAIGQVAAPFAIHLCLGIGFLLYMSKIKTAPHA